jgi:DNA-directed RNA polymerase subunit RPC12/RpoP
MDFLKGICPHCEGELQIPQGLEKITCMYCGKELLVSDALEREKQQSRPAAVSKEDAIQALQGLLYGIENPIQFFKKALYMEFFQKYLYENARNLAMLEQAYLASETPTETLQEIAEPLVERVEQELAGTKARKRDQAQMDYNLSMVVYVFPALLENNEKSGQAWIDVLSATWKKHFPKTELKAATAKEINAGFRYRFCYITTAVCESQNKPNDCYELSVLRAFRDDYLLKSDEGEAMVHEYYDVAPTIVKHIKKRKDADEIYQDIWQQYLSPCIRLIESDKNEECVDLYKQMVYNLKEKYFN